MANICNFESFPFSYAVLIVKTFEVYSYSFQYEKFLVKLTNIYYFFTIIYYFLRVKLSSKIDESYLEELEKKMKLMSSLHSQSPRKSLEEGEAGALII